MEFREKAVLRVHNRTQRAHNTFHHTLDMKHDYYFKECVIVDGYGDCLCVGNLVCKS